VHAKWLRGDTTGRQWFSFGSHPEATPGFEAGEVSPANTASSLSTTSIFAVQRHQPHRQCNCTAFSSEGYLTPMNASNTDPTLTLGPNETGGPDLQQAVADNAVDVVPWLPCTVSVDIPLSRFTIADLTRIGKGSVVTTPCPHLSEIPLYVNGQLIGWTEFEVIDERLAVRITELA